MKKYKSKKVYIARFLGADGKKYAFVIDRTKKPIQATGFEVVQDVDENLRPVKCHYSPAGLADFVETETLETNRQVLLHDKLCFSACVSRCITEDGRKIVYVFDNTKIPPQIFMFEVNKEYDPFTSTEKEYKGTTLIGLDKHIDGKRDPSRGV